LQELRAQQSRLEADLRFLRDHRDVVQDLLDEGRIYQVGIPFAEEPVMHLVTRNEALRILAINYMLRISAENRPYNAAEFERSLLLARENADRLRFALQDALAESEAEAERLLRRLAGIETEIASQETPSGEPGVSSRPCVELVQIIQRGALADAAHVPLGADMHSVTRREGGVSGQPVDMSITWTPPPRRICAGDLLTLSMTVRNNLPRAAADSSLAFTHATYHGSGSDISCTNPPPETMGLGRVASGIALNQTVHSNSCSLTAPTMGDWSSPRMLYHIDISAMMMSGRVGYLYQ
jgi:hypothetical protein